MSDAKTSSIRIALVSSFMPPHLGGLETAIETLFKTYRQTECEVRWIASHVPATTFRSEDGRIRVGCCNLLEQWLGVPWPIWGLEGVRELVRMARWADVIHVHECLYLSSVLAVVIARWIRKPVVLSQHIGFAQYRSPILRALVWLAYHTVGRFVLQRAMRIVLCTPAAEAYVSALFGGTPAHATAIPYGIDTAQFRPPTPDERIQARRSLGFPEAGRVVLFTGRLLEKKGVDLFLEVCRRQPTGRFLIVGDGPCRPPAIKNLRWIPFVPPDRMVPVYHAVDALVLPSRSEGFSLAVLEAMGAGVPVVLSKGLAFGDMLAREGACLLAERTVQGFVEALDQLTMDPALGAALAAKARALTVRRWSVQQMIARHLVLLHDILKGSK